MKRHNIAAVFTVVALSAGTGAWACAPSCRPR